MSIANYNSTSQKSNNFNGREEKRPDPTWQFRDMKIPARLFYLLCKGGEEGITGRDVCLMAIIDALVKPQGTEDGIGCWASNAYLANAVGINPTWVSERLSHLQRLGLLLSVNMNGQRYLELDWSRTTEERSELAGEYGELIRKAHAELTQRLERLRENSKDPPSGKLETPLREKQKQSNTTVKDYPQENKICRGDKPRDATHNGSPSLNGNGKHAAKEGTPPEQDKKERNSKVSARNRMFPVQEEKEEQEPPARELATKLHRFLMGKNKVMRKPAFPRWVAAFVQALKYRDEDSIHAVMDGYFKHFDHPFMVDAFCGEKFCEQMPRIEKQIARIEMEQKREKAKKLDARDINLW